MFDLAIVNGDVWMSTGFSKVDLGIDQGRLVTVTEAGKIPGAVRTIDATGLFVLPGVIDSHFHCRAPANPEREDFASGTRGAAAGGVTAIIEMPIAIPPTTDGPSLNVRREHAERDSYVDFGFYSSSATLDRERLRSSVEAGAIGFKAFLQDVPAGREDEFDGLCIHRNYDIMHALELVGETGLLAAFHSEDFDTLTYLDAKLHRDGRTDGAAHGESRPDFVEAIAIATLIFLSEATGTHLHLPHVSSRRSVELIRAAKRRGALVTAETCPQYLSFDSDRLRDLGPYAKCNPPFKTQDDIDALWDGLADGTIDTIASDHSPFTVAEKEAAWSDIWAAPPGFPGVESLAPFVISAGLSGRIPLETAIATITSNPADIFQLTPMKGRIRPGADADFTLYDPNAETIVDISRWQSRARGTAKIWDGLTFTGKVVSTIVRGQVVYDNGEIVGEPGYGTLMRPILDDAQTSRISG